MLEGQLLDAQKTFLDALLSYEEAEKQKLSDYCDDKRENMNRRHADEMRNKMDDASKMLHKLREQNEEMLNKLTWDHRTRQVRHSEIYIYIYILHLRCYF